MLTRLRVIVALASVAALVVGPIPPAAATNLAAVERQVEQLQEQAATAAEEWNQARTELDRINQRISSLRGRSQDQQAQYKIVSAELGGLIRGLYKTGGIDLDIQAMVATDPAGFLNHLDAISVVGLRQQATLRKLLAAHVDMTQTNALLKAERVKAQRVASRANSKLKLVNAKLSQAQSLLDSLQEKDRKARAAALAKKAKEQAQKAKKYSSKLKSVPSARIRKVLAYALRQVGDNYGAGGTGPSTYDCSGLTMMAYRQIGVSISHFSGSQWDQTRRVSRAALRPGDLIFFFRGIRHVAMYIGNNRFVHAASYRYGVIVSSLSESYYAARLSGFGRVVG